MGLTVRRRLECQVCGRLSKWVETYPPSDSEARMIEEFKSEHDQCARRINQLLPVDSADVIMDGKTQPQVGPFGSYKPDPVSISKPHGHGHYIGPYGEEQEVDTISCCHCRKHMEARRGIHTQLGWCGRCNAYTCNSLSCQVCVPYEQRLDNCDKGLPELTPKPDSVLISAASITSIKQ